MQSEHQAVDRAIAAGEWVSVVVAIFLSAACAQTDLNRTEAVAEQVVENPLPSCEPGHHQALSNGLLHIKPGQTVCVQLKVLGNVVVPSVVVGPNAESSGTLIVRAWPDPRTNATYLYIHNPLERLLQYNASMLRSGSLQWEHTSTCAVLPHRVGFEQWPYPINEFKLGDFVVLPESKQIECK